MVEEAEKVAKLTEILTRRLADSIKSEIVDYDKLHSVLSKVHANTVSALERIGRVEQQPVKLDKMIENGDLKNVLETYSDILVALVRQKFAQ